MGGELGSMSIFERWARALALTFVPCVAVGGTAALVYGEPGYLYVSLGLGIILEIYAAFAMLLDSAGLPGGVIVGSVAFFPVSLIALVLFRHQIGLDDLLAGRPKHT